MDDAEIVKQDTEKLAHLEEEIQQARHHLDEETHEKEKREPYLFEDDQEEPEAPGNDSVPG